MKYCGFFTVYWGFLSHKVLACRKSGIFSALLGMNDADFYE